MRLVPRALVALQLLLGLAACSSGSDESASTTTTTTSTTTTTIKTLKADEVDAQASPYCAAWAEIRKLGGPAISGDSTKATEARKAHYAKLVPLAEKLVAVASADIKADATYALNQVKEVASSGSDAPFKQADASKVQQHLAKYALDHCTSG